jgi:hypothetical protein
MSPYRVAGALLEPVVPKRGPCWDGTACRVRVHDRRQRKTGPPWGWVAVLRCEVHGVSFTAYPLGYYPYGRVPLVDLALDGSDLEIEDDDDASVGTLLEASVDASQGELWPREGAEGGVRSTQRRRLRGAATLLGLVSLADAQGVDPEVAAEVAQVPAGLLIAASGALEKARGLKAWGQEIRGTLERLLGRASLWLADRLAVLGFLAGCWGHPYRWRCSGGGRLIALGRGFWNAAGSGRARSRSRDGP